MSLHKKSNKQDRPNILIIYPDEMRADMMGCAGNPVIKTPFCNRIAQEGVRFEEAFSSFPLCTPFRASLFTGKYNHATGVYANHHPIPLGQNFLAEILRDNGYQTGYVGKWHLDGGDAPGFVPPGSRRLGFDSFVGFNRGHYYQNAIYYRNDGQPYHCPRYEPDFQTEHIISFMDQCQAAKDGPFFGMICYGAPHFPFSMPEYYKSLYRPDEMPLGPSAGNADMQKQVIKYLKDNNFPAASGLWGIGTGADPKLESEQEIREFMALYYGMMANVDFNIGRILNWLDKSELYEDTMVILLSDHGDMCGEHGYRSGTKKTPYRQAAQVPLLIRYPRRFPAGLTIPSLVDVSVDTFPTILDLCGIPLPDNIHGTSFLSLLEGDSTPVRNAVYYQVNKELEGPERFPVPERGVRTAEWLYCRNEQGPSMLYDLHKDPDELNNLVNEKRYESDLQQLDRMLGEHMELTGDDWSAESVFPPANFLTHEDKTKKQNQLLRDAIIEP